MKYYDKNDFPYVRVLILLFEEIQGLFSVQQGSGPRITLPGVNFINVKRTNFSYERTFW